MNSLLLDTDLMKKLKLNIGLVEIHGELTGENLGSSESKCTVTTSVLKKTAVLPCHHLLRPPKKHSHNEHVTNSEITFFILSKNFDILNYYSLL
jgi:hypothetical protein